MPRTSKTPRYDEFNSFDNCFGDYQIGKRKWQDFFEKDQPIVLELGCGKAEVLLELARNNPKGNFIGIDLKADRMWRAALVAQKEDLKNVAFIQSDIRQLDKYFNESSIEELWITFPDPYPKKKQAKHRMTGPDFLPVYKKLLSPKGIINFKTDDPSLFRWSLEEFVKAKLEFLDLTFDLYGDKTRTHAKTLTTFEKRWLAMGKKVHYAKLCFK